MFYPFDFGFEQVFCKCTKFTCCRVNSTARRIFFTVAKYSTVPMPVPKKCRAAIGMLTRLSRHYNGMLKLHVFKDLRIVFGGFAGRSDRRRRAATQPNFNLGQSFAGFLIRSTPFPKNWPNPWSSLPKKPFR
ncbi:MAG: hypothetical protein WA900_13670 [Casimicrobiaceae bacterium]